MSCADIQDLLDAYLDGELDVAHHRAVERHLDECPACSQATASLATLQAMLRAEAPRYSAPPQLQERIRESLRAAAGVPPRTRLRPQRWLVVAASLALVCLTGLAIWGLAHRGAVAAEEEAMAEEVVASHVRSLLADHLVDVKSADGHTVKPWFHGRVDFAPAVVDLAGEGFPLVGGRLDYLHGRVVAALVYRRREHKINLLLWPSAHPPAPVVKEMTRQGYNLAHWDEAGMSCWAVSDLNAAELHTFAEKVRDRMRPGEK